MKGKKILANPPQPPSFSWLRDDLQRVSLLAVCLVSIKFMDCRCSFGSGETTIEGVGGEGGELLYELHVSVRTLGRQGRARGRWS